MLSRRGLLQYLLLGVAGTSLSACQSRSALRLAIHPWIGYETLYLLEELGQLPSDIVLEKFTNNSEKMTPLQQGLLDGGAFTLDEVLSIRAQGIPLTIYAISDDKKVVHNYVAIFSDISQQKAQQAKLERLLHYDVLTGLPNRSLLNDRVKQALITAREQQHYVAIVFIDLDGFKAVNDTYGHNAGDSLLTELGNRFLTVMRSQCTIARIGGDEFIAVMTNLTSRESAYPILDQLLAVCNQPFLINGEAVTISASIGVDFYTPSDYDQEISEVNLIQQADKAMYIAKQQGKNQIWFFDQNHHSIDNGVKINGT